MLHGFKVLVKEVSIKSNYSSQLQQTLTLSCGLKLGVRGGGRGGDKLT